MSLMKIFRENEGVGRSPLYRALAQMLMVFISETLVKRLDTSEEHKKTESAWRVKLCNVLTKYKSHLHNEKSKVKERVQEPK